MKLIGYLIPAYSFFIDNLIIHVLLKSRGVGNKIPVKHLLWGIMRNFLAVFGFRPLF